MSDEERQAILAKLKASIDEARKMTQKQARGRLQAEGLCDERGRLTEAYGGMLLARG
jgi:hypothetical protein